MDIHKVGYKRGDWKLSWQFESNFKSCLIPVIKQADGLVHPQAFGGCVVSLLVLEPRKKT
jgi:hypothetical protein